MIDRDPVDRRGVTLMIAEVILFEIALITILMVCTSLPWKMIRFVMDSSQYGNEQFKLSTGSTNDARVIDTQELMTNTVAVNMQESGGNDEIRPSEIAPRLQAYMHRVKQEACVTWPLLDDFVNEWRCERKLSSNNCPYVLARRRGRGRRQDGLRRRRVDIVNNFVSNATETAGTAPPAATDVGMRARNAVLGSEHHVASSSGGGGFGAGSYDDVMTWNGADTTAAQFTTILFVHGGGLVSGSPLKQNPYNWITTIAHFTESCDTLLLPSYSLAPEAKAPQALLDLLNVLYDRFAVLAPPANLEFIGFSAGCFLLLQLYLALLRFARPDPASGSIFGIDPRQPERLVRNYSDARTRLILRALHTVHLCSGFYRTDSLFLTPQFDASSVLQQFVRIYASEPLEQDPLLQLTKMLSIVNESSPPLFRIYDANYNSLSNHGIQLHALLLRTSKLHIFDKSFFAVDRWLLQHGNLKHKFLRNLSSVHDRDKRDRLTDFHINAIHNHFFPFMASTEAGRITMHSIVTDLNSASVPLPPPPFPAARVNGHSGCV